MKLCKAIILFCILCLSLTSCHNEKDDSEARKGSRVVLVYMVSENSLVGYDNQDISEMLRGISRIPDGDKLLLYVDSNELPAIYCLNNKTNATQLSELTPEFVYSEERNSCSEEQMSDVLSYVQTHHRAESYGIVLWSHGSGWLPSFSNYEDYNFVRRRSFGIDNGKNTNVNSGYSMSISKLHNALKSMGKKFDYVMFDACFMQGIEVVYELRDVANYIISSPAEIPAEGAVYNQILLSLFDKENYARSISESYVQSYRVNSSYGALVSTVDCKQLDELAKVSASLVAQYKDNFLNADYSDVLKYFTYAWRNMSISPDMFDMGGVFKTALPADKYVEWKKAFDKAVPYSFATTRWYSDYMRGYIHVDEDMFSGLNMCVPLSKYTNDKYAADNGIFINAFYQSQWAKAVWASDAKNN